MVSRWIEGFRFCIRDLIEAPSVRTMQQFTQHGDVSTLEHCLMVAFLSYLICRMIGLNFYAAARGGLLHKIKRNCRKDSQVSRRTMLLLIQWMRADTAQLLTETTGSILSV